MSSSSTTRTYAEPTVVVPGRTSLPWTRPCGATSAARPGSSRGDCAAQALSFNGRDREDCPGPAGGTCCPHRRTSGRAAALPVRPAGRRRCRGERATRGGRSRATRAVRHVTQSPGSHPGRIRPHSPDRSAHSSRAAPITVSSLTLPSHSKSEHQAQSPQTGNLEISLRNAPAAGVSAGTWRRDGCQHLPHGRAQRSSRRNACGAKGRNQRLLTPLGSGWFLGVTCSWQVCQRGLGSSQVSREAWSAMFMIFGLVGGGFLMTISGAPAGSSPEASLATPTNASAAPGGGWRAALFLAGAAQMITIPARASPDRLGVLVVPAVGAVEPRGEQAARGRRCEQMSCHPGSGKKAG